MASFLRETDKDELVSCPYDPVHKVKKSRLQLHIAKCQKRNAEEEKRICPFNALHHISPAEYTHHLRICPSREIADRQLIKYSEEQKKITNEDSDREFNTTENWDQDIDPLPRPGYDPKSSQKKAIFCDISDKTPAERRKYYEKLHSMDTNNEEPQEAVTEWKLKEIRQPKDKPEVLQYHASASSNVSLGLGRGTVAGSRRIAANIFGQGDNSVEKSLYSKAVGRGLGKENV
ncbi:gametocyte-specific factor 1 homolog [Centruroides vittatus]|uniref:gametocyte-specific factor 1 homolog n=1 Tax=Centruroides vittatus TaxID=120091 RepID=UPI003510C2B4